LETKLTFLTDRNNTDKRILLSTR